MLTTQYKRVLKRALRTTRRQQTRTLVTELLELRQLLYSEAILLSPPITLPSTTDRELAAIEGSRLINDSELGRAASTRINGAFDLSRETLEPKAELTSFRQRLPQPEALQYELIGAQFGPRLDWESIETGGGEVRQSSVTPVTAEQIVRITNEGVSQFFVGQSQARDHGLPTSQSIQEGSGLSGGYCLTDGELVFGSSIDSSMSSMGLAEGEGDEEAAPEFAIPEINIPRLELSSALGGPDNFMPVVQRTSTSTKTHGSFTSNSLDAPDLQADGTNWVHFVTRNWTSSEQWSFTERLVFVFNVEQNVQDSGDLDELNDGGTEDEDGSETGLAESGNWTSNVGVTRAGYFILTFSASRGISTPSHLGVVWSLNVSYRDGISVSASLNGASTFAPDPNVTTTSGDENAPDVPEDFVGHSSWGASGGVSVLSSGGFSVTSIPRLRITGPERIITASGHTEFGGSVDVASNWSASSISGNLIPPSGLNGCVTCSSGAPYSPLPNGGDLGIAYDAASNAIDASDDDLDVPFDPLGEFEGYGHAASSSGGNSARLSAKIGGSWDLSGVLRNGHYVNLVGGAFAAMESDTTGHGKSKHLFVYQPEPEVTELLYGTLTSKVQLKSGWDYTGTQGEGLDSDIESTIAGIDSGELNLTPTEDSAEIEGNGNLRGFDFLLIRAGIDKVTSWDFADEALTGGGMRHYWRGHDNNKLSIAYHSASYGTTIGTYESTADELTAQNATAVTDLNGRGHEVLEITKTASRLDERSEEWPHEHWVEHEDGSLSSFEKFVNRHHANGTLTATLNADDSVSWTGDASESVSSTVEYRAEQDFESSGQNLKGGGGWGYASVRDAEFDRAASLVANFDETTGEFVNTFTVTGDSQVLITGHDTYGQPWEKTELELALETIFIDGSTGYPELPEQEDPSSGLPPNIQYASNPGTNGWLAWFAGTPGDSFDQGLNFVAGVADSATPTSYLVRKGIGLASGFDGADEETTAYFAGEVTGTVVSFAVPGGGAANRLSNSFTQGGRCANWLTKLRHGGCFVAGTLVTVSELPDSHERYAALWDDTDWLDELQIASSWPTGSNAEATPASSLATASTVRLAIEQVPLGARIPTKNPKPWEFDDSLPEPEQDSWVKLSITVERTDGGVVDAELLRPRAWVNDHGIEAGQLLPLNIAELQVAGYAHVTAIEPCPPIAGGEGSVVTARFVTRQVDVIARIEVLGADGRVETIEGTTIHPIWSLDRNDWVPLGELEEGEQLLGQAGPALVLSHAILHRRLPVYNIEVHGEHVYEVGELGALVHNTYADEVFELAPGQLVGGFMTRGGKLIAPLFTNTAGGHPEAVLAVSGLTSRLKNGSAFAFSVGKRMDGTIDVFPSGAFPVPGGMTNAMKVMVLKYVK